MKAQLLKDFNTIYQNKRLLSIQLNGFTHSVFYDSNTRDSDIIIEKHSSYISSYEKDQRFTNEAYKLLSKYNHYTYQGNAKEILYILPKDR